MNKNMQRLSKQDLEALTVGAAILGSGGGGNPYYGKLHLLQQLAKHNGHVDLMPLHALDDNALVVAISGMGAPTVSIEKICEGQEMLRALQAVQRATGKRIDAVMTAEVGGANGVRPMVTALQAHLPFVDADGMGRAFPEMHMNTFSIYGHCSAPAAMSDAHSNTVLFAHLVDEARLERLARACVVHMGCTAGIATAPMTGSFVKQYAVPNSVTQALQLGQRVLAARAQGTDPIAAICRHQAGLRLFCGKIVDVQRRLQGGFAVGQVHLQGIQQYQDQTAQIDVQNENLLFRCQGRVTACVPDLIVVLDAHTGQAISTELLRYGQTVSVLGLPCHDLLRTPQALNIVGPTAFGYDEVTYRPIATQHEPPRSALTNSAI